MRCACDTNGSRKNKAGTHSAAMCEVLCPTLVVVSLLQLPTRDTAGSKNTAAKLLTHLNLSATKELLGCQPHLTSSWVHSAEVPQQTQHNSRKRPTQHKQSSASRRVSHTNHHIIHTAHIQHSTHTHACVESTPALREGLLNPQGLAHISLKVHKGWLVAPDCLTLAVNKELGVVPGDCANLLARATRNEHIC